MPTGRMKAPKCNCRGPVIAAPCSVLPHHGPVAAATAISAASGGKAAIVVPHSTKDKIPLHAQLARRSAHHARSRSRSGPRRLAGARVLPADDGTCRAAAGRLDLDHFSGRGAQRGALFVLQFDGSDPPYVAFGSSGVKDSLANLREVPEFVANIVTMHLLERMNFTSGDFPREEDEFDWAQLTAVPAAKVRPYRVAEAKAHLECEVAQIVTDRNTNIVLGRIIHAHVNPSVWKNGRVDPKLLDPVCRLSGSGYAALGDLVNVQRPQWRNIEGTIGLDAMPRAERR